MVLSMFLVRSNRIRKWFSTYEDADFFRQELLHSGHNNVFIIERDDMTHG